ncbi:MAG: hypothetical protein M1819_003858 [Sarea resinae]|nr:MAG: hypothetical protein M1819_003858 [Sarea resinae]
MNAMRQRCRPKHQVLILKCYPRFQKNAVDVKPNSSELSYLLYYASTRRSKVQKVGEFLEKRTARDVWRGRIGNVQVTLQIIKAFIEKSPRDLLLYAAFILRILTLILRSNDITMVEYSIPTFETFCMHQDPATWAAAHDYVKQYEGIVQMYAEFGSTNLSDEKKLPISTPMAIRWRSVGLRAIKSVTLSETLGTDPGRQLSYIMPAILQNLYSDTDDYLFVLQQRSQAKEETDREQLLRRRTSTATVRTSTTTDGDPAVASGTADDVDKLAEEEVGLIALQSLKQIFVVNNRLQIRQGTAALLIFITKKLSPRASTQGLDSVIGSSGGWTTTLTEMVAKWAPVQDRYVILVTAMEALVRSPMKEENVQQQLVLVAIVSWLLSSKINLIGLSVMDVLLGLVHHILLVLQLGGRGTSVLPHHQQSEAVGIDLASEKTSQLVSSGQEAPTIEPAESATFARKELLLKLQKTIGDLATHIYYTDQISDMVAAILVRLKPPPVSGMVGASAVEDPSGAANAIVSSANLLESSNTDGFFSFDTARITALSAIKEILVVANMRASSTGAAALARNRVGTQVWDGTQWLLRDTDGRVRRAYADALLTWLDLEVSKDSFRALDERPRSVRSQPRKLGEEPTRKVASANAHRDRSPKPKTSAFLQLLHLAIYENAIQNADSEPDILMLHLILTALVSKLGVNAVKSGLPMIFRLQEDIMVVDSPTAKIRIGSLVHGYFWVLSDQFGFETSHVGREIQNEILRRKEKGLWVEKIGVPPATLGQINMPGVSSSVDRLTLEVFQRESLRPFDDRASMVDLIASSYSVTVASPPISPPTSPRRFSVSMHKPNGSVSNYFEGKPLLPNRVRDQMLSDWSKEAILAKVELEKSGTTSLNGSKSGTNRSGTRNFLAVNGNGENQAASRNVSPLFQHQLQQPRPASATYGLIGCSFMAQRRASTQEGSPTPHTTSSRNSTVRVDELKRVLTGRASTANGSMRGAEYYNNDTSSESMISADFSASDASYTLGRPTATGISPADFAVFANEPKTTESREGSMTPRAQSRGDSDARNENTLSSANEGPESIPPVPPLPASLPLPSSLSAKGDDREVDRAGRSLKQRKGRSMSAASRSEVTWGGKIDLTGLLSGIEIRDGALKGLGGITKGLGRPPY